MRWRTSASSASSRGAYDVIILNFANCDMVGHTGVFDAAVQGRGDRGRLRGPGGGRHR